MDFVGMTQRLVYRKNWKYVVSKGGFIEGSQNRPLMQVLENFCNRCNFQWCGGVGIGGGVMLNVMRIMFLVYAGLFVLNTITSGLSGVITYFCRAVGSSFVF